MKKILIAIGLIFTFYFTLSTDLHASYNFNPYGDDIEQAESMTVKKVIDNSTVKSNISGMPSVIFGNLKDLVTYEGKTYVCDQTNGKIWVLDEDFIVSDFFPKVIQNSTKLYEETSLEKTEIAKYTLNKPEGVYAKNDILYVCDTENMRVVSYDLNSKEFIQEIKEPNSPIFQEKDDKGQLKLLFKPLKISVDRTGRMFVIAKDVYEGILDFDSNGNLNRFFGTNKVSMNFFETIIYKFSSEEQKKSMAKKLQASFINLELDNLGNTYVLSNPKDTQEILKKLNNKGKDILEDKGYVPVVGDAWISQGFDNVGSGPSKFVDVAVKGDGSRYSAIDDVRGKIFTYDREGNLLYICGQIGNQSTTFKKATSIAYLGDKIITCDEDKKSIIIFEPTKFGNLINEATDLYLNYDYSGAKLIWEEVIKHNSNYYLAYAGIGKAQLRENNYKEALGNLKLGADYYNYSQAYDLYRNEQLSKVLPVVIAVGIIGLLALFVLNIKNSVKRDKEGE